jgi:hypothetical protein
MFQFIDTFLLYDFTNGNIEHLYHLAKLKFQDIDSIFTLDNDGKLLH